MFGTAENCREKWLLVKIYENGKMFTWIWVFLLCSWKIKNKIFLKLEDQK